MSLSANSEVFMSCTSVEVCDVSGFCVCILYFRTKFSIQRILNSSKNFEWNVLIGLYPFLSGIRRIFEVGDVDARSQSRKESGILDSFNRFNCR